MSFIWKYFFKLFNSSFNFFDFSCFKLRRHILMVDSGISRLQFSLSNNNFNLLNSSSVCWKRSLSFLRLTLFALLVLYNCKKNCESISLVFFSYSSFGKILWHCSISFFILVFSISFKFPDFITLLNFSIFAKLFLCSFSKNSLSTLFNFSKNGKTLVVISRNLVFNIFILSSTSFWLLKYNIVNFSLNIFLFASFGYICLIKLKLISPVLILLKTFSLVCNAFIKYFVLLKSSNWILSNNPPFWIPSNNLKDSISFSALNNSSSLITKLSILLNNDPIIFCDFIFCNKNKIFSAFNNCLFFVKKFVMLSTTFGEISL